MLSKWLLWEDPRSSVVFQITREVRLIRTWRTIVRVIFISWSGMVVLGWAAWVMSWFTIGEWWFEF